VELGHGFFGHVAAFGDLPFVVLFDDDGGDEAEGCGVVGENPDHVDPAFDFTVDAFTRVGGPDLAPVLDGEAGEGEEIFAGVGQTPPAPSTTAS
jgi:hypothetical protein